MDLSADLESTSFCCRSASRETTESERVRLGLLVVLDRPHALQSLCKRNVCLVSGKPGKKFPGRAWARKDNVCCVSVLTVLHEVRGHVGAVAFLPPPGHRVVLAWSAIAKPG